MKIDLGCGENKQVGFVGVDRFIIEGVDIVADLNNTLPFDDDSVDFLFASHSLEHVSDLMATMREVFRICKHGAQVCIVAPYSEQKLNIANPYHIYSFNEHTPRFWTDYPQAFIDPAEYAHPHAANWGLAKSDHSDPGLELRLVRMEFFYYPEYRNLSDEEQRTYRSQRIDVCDQIMYHLIVWKGDELQGLSFNEMVSCFEPFEPAYVKQRKTLEREESLMAVAEECDIALSNAQDVDQKHSSVQLKALELLEKQVVDLMAENQQLQLQLTRDSDKIESILNQQHEEKLSATKVYEENKMLRIRCEAAKDEVKRLVSDLHRQGSSQHLSIKSRLTNFLKNKDVLWDAVSPAFSALKTYSSQKFKNTSNARLTLSDDLGSIPYREYRMPFMLNSLSSVSLAINPLLPADAGVVGVEIVSSELEVQTQETRPLSEVTPDAPTVFTLPVICMKLEKPWALRVFVRGADVPVTIYEFISYTTFMRKVNYKPFVCLSC